MTSLFRIPRWLFEETLEDLRRPHPRAGERCAFLRCRVGELDGRGWIILACGLLSLPDDAYEPDAWGCTINGTGIRSALRCALTEPVSLFHVHLHEHHGIPAFSRPDLDSLDHLIPDLCSVEPQLPHGGVVLSRDLGTGRVWMPGEGRPCAFDELAVVGFPYASTVWRRRARGL